MAIDSAQCTSFLSIFFSAHGAPRSWVSTQENSAVHFAQNNSQIFRHTAPITIHAATNTTGYNHIAVADGTPGLKNATHTNIVPAPQPAFFKQQRSRADKIAIAEATSGAI